MSLLPEERLLKLIRRQGAKPAPGVSSAPAAQPVIAGARGAAAALRRLPWIRVIVLGLGAVLLIQGAWIVAQLARPLPPVETPMATPAPAAPEAAAPAPVPEMPSLAASASPQLFIPAAPAGSTGSAAPSRVPSASLRQLAARLTLQGIVAGEAPQAIIADSQTQKTYFVSKGQMVVDGAVLAQVLDNRVVLDLDGETIDLNL